MMINEKQKLVNNFTKQLNDDIMIGGKFLDNGTLKLLLNKIIDNYLKDKENVEGVILYRLYKTPFAIAYAIQQ